MRIILIIFLICLLIYVIFEPRIDTIKLKSNDKYYWYIIWFNRFRIQEGKINKDRAWWPLFSKEND